MAGKFGYWLGKKCYNSIFLGGYWYFGCFCSIAKIKLGFFVCVFFLGLWCCRPKGLLFVMFIFSGSCQSTKLELPHCLLNKPVTDLIKDFVFVRIPIL